MHLGAPSRAYISGHVGAHNTPHNTSRFKQVQACSSKYTQVQVKERGLDVLSGPRGRRPKAAAPQMRPQVANFAMKLPGADATNTPTPPQRRGTRPSTP